AVLEQHGIKSSLNRFGSLMTVFFGVGRVENADDARKCDRKQFARFFHGLLSRGIYLPPSPFEAMFISLVHSNADLNATIRAFDQWATTESQT
ncbi:MAG TPA: aspartate aminotransferase family protein, partial [Candidatus Binatia bacterium]|nr:aspartate aminotransferase family protein [Candidatus Binatia bacterium]